MITIFDRSDLIEHSKEKPIRQLTLADIRFSVQPAQMSSAVIFVDVNKGLLRVLKWKWKPDFDINGVFDIKELKEIVHDALNQNNIMGKSLRIPGTDKLRK